MAYQLFNLPPQQPLSAAGRVLPGSKASFFLTETDTPTPVYTTSALNVTHTQPVEADAGGRLPAIYLDPTITYKVTVTNSADVLLYTVDPVNDQLLSQAVIGEYLYPRTSAEQSAGVTPVNYAYPPGDVRRYGADPTGVGDSTDAIQRAIDVAEASSIGGYVYLPSGTYRVTSTLTVAADRIHVYGDGIDATRVLFDPSANDTLWEFTQGATSTWQCSLSHMTLYSNDSTYTKVALDLYDIRTFVCEQVWIGGSVAISGSAYWAGNSASIGVRTHGREFGTFRNMLIAADRPIVLAENPNDDRSADHFHFSDLFLIANANPVVEIQTGLNISNLLFDGYQSWNRGTHGLYWVDTTAPDEVSYKIVLRNVRTEQGTDATAYSFRVERHASSSIQDIKLDNCLLDTARRGIYMRRCERITLDSVGYPGSSGIAVDITGITATTLRTENCLFNTGSTATLTNLRLLFGVPNDPSQALSANGIYGYDGNATRNVTLGGAISEYTVEVADTATADLGTTSMFGMLFINASADNAVAQFALRGTNNVTVEISDSTGLFSAASGTATSTNVYWDAGASRYRIENNRGGSRTYRVTFIGTYS